MKNKKTEFTQQEVDKIVKEMLTESEMSAIRQREKISELKAEVLRLQRAASENEKREIEIADAIDRYKKRNTYLENIINMRFDLEISRLEAIQEILEEDFGDYDKLVKEKLEAVIASIKAFSNDITEVEEIAKIEPTKPMELSEDLDKRYMQILSLYNYTMANSGTKKRGRPKKGENDIETYLSDVKKENDSKEHIEPFDFEEKFRAFGFEAITIDGNDVEQLYNALTREPIDKPIAIILDTVKGKGIAEVENTMGNHSMTPPAESFVRWLDELHAELDAMG